MSENLWNFRDFFRETGKFRLDFTLEIREKSGNFSVGFLDLSHSELLTKIPRYLALGHKGLKFSKNAHTIYYKTLQINYSITKNNNYYCYQPKILFINLNNYSINMSTQLINKEKLHKGVIYNQ